MKMTLFKAAALIAVVVAQPLVISPAAAGAADYDLICNMKGITATVSNTADISFKVKGTRTLARQRLPAPGYCAWVVKLQTSPTKVWLKASKKNRYTFQLSNGGRAQFKQWQRGRRSVKKVLDTIIQGRNLRVQCKWEYIRSKFCFVAKVRR